MRPLLLSLSACLLLLALSACGDPSETGDPTKVKYAPSLGVDLAAMNRSESGLYTQDTTVGTGEEVTPGRTAFVHYSGWLADGSLFDTSRDNDRPFSFEVGAGRVIKGWDEGVGSMKVGGKRTLIIPPDIAYGARGRAPVIPPDAVLIFDVELVYVR